VIHLRMSSASSTMVLHQSFLCWLQRAHVSIIEVEKFIDCGFIRCEVCTILMLSAWSNMTRYAVVKNVMKIVIVVK